MPQIDHLGKMSTVLRVSTHIYGVFQEINGKMFIFRVNLGMWPLKSIVLEKWALFWGFQHTFMGFLRIWWENMHFESTPRHVTPQIDRLGKMNTVLRVSTHIYGVSRHVTPQIDCLENTSTVLRVSTDIYGVSKEIDGKTFIFRVNLGMWPLKSIVLEKWALFWGSEDTFMGFFRR